MSRSSAVQLPMAPIVVCLVAVVLAPDMPYVGLPLAAAALAAMAFNGRGVTAVLTASAAAGVVAFLGGIPAAVVVTPALAAILVTASMLRERSAARTTVGLAVVLTAVFVMADVLAARLTGMAFKAFITESTAQAAAAAAALAGTGAVTEQVKEIAQFLARTWPADYVVTGIVSAVGVVTAIGWASHRVGVATHRLPRLDSVDLSPYVLLAPTVALVLMAVGRMNTPALVTTLGLNLLLIARPLFVWQGLAVTADLLRRRNVALVGRVFVYGAAAFFELLFLGLSIIGLLDLRVNFRKLVRYDEHTDDTQSPTSSI